jgi:hypothetical protein
LEKDRPKNNATYAAALLFNSKALVSAKNRQKNTCWKAGIFSCPEEITS